MSSLKIIAAVESQKIDMAIFNEEAFTIMTKSGYLLDLNDFITNSYLADNEYLASHLVSLEKENNPDMIASGFDISEIMNAKGFNLSDRVYLGIIANTKHSVEVLDYLRFVSTIIDESK